MYLKYYFNKLTNNVKITYEELIIALNFVRFITFYYIFYL